MKDPLWYKTYFLATMNLYKKGSVVIPISQLQSDFQSWGRLALAINGRVYDINDYMTLRKCYDAGSTTMRIIICPKPSKKSLPNSAARRHRQWNQYKDTMDGHVQAMNLELSRQLFYIGNLDQRDTARCTVYKLSLAVFACTMCLVIRCQVPCGAPIWRSADARRPRQVCDLPGAVLYGRRRVIRKTIDSLTVMKYDDQDASCSFYCGWHDYRQWQRQADATYRARYSRS